MLNSDALKYEALLSKFFNEIKLEGYSSYDSNYSISLKFQDIEEGNLYTLFKPIFHYDLWQMNNSGGGIKLGRVEAISSLLNKRLSFSTLKPIDSTGFEIVNKKYSLSLEDQLDLLFQNQK